MLLSTLLCLAAAGDPPPHAGHIQALVNDSRSHGQVGDNFLSLNEAILLNKRALSTSQLSPAELAQLQGPPGDVAIVNVDTTVVPKITCERDLDTIDNTPHGFVLTTAFNQAEIDLNGTRGFIVNADFADFRNLIIENAPVAISLTQHDGLYGTVVENVLFRQISNTAILAAFVGDQLETRLEVSLSVFEQVPTAVELFDLGTNRHGNLLFHDSEIRGGQRGWITHLGPGGSLNVSLERVATVGTGLGIAFDRPSATDTRLVFMTGLHVATTGGSVGFAFQGHPAVADNLTLRMFDFGGSAYAARFGPMGGGHALLLEDGRIAGPSELLVGAAAGATLRNARAKSSTLAVGGTGPQIAISDSVFDHVALQTQGSAPVLVSDSCFLGGSAGAGLSAPLTVDHSFVGTATVGPNTSIRNALPKAQLGSMDAAPVEPKIGTSTTLSSDLPSGLHGVWLFGLAETSPYLGTPPLHLYFWLTYYVALPIAVRGQMQTVVPIPNAPSLMGWNFVGQLAVLPDPGMQAPPLSLPPGRRILIH